MQDRSQNGAGTTSPKSNVHSGLACLIKKGLVAWAIFICMPVAFASPGTEWLETRLQADGSFDSLNTVSSAYQATAETLRAFKAVGDPIAVDISSSLTFINATNFNNTEVLARKIIANIEAGNSVIALTAQLLQHQNPDGGFGEFAGYQSTVFDTALALEALAVTGNPTSSAAESAIGYMRGRQNSDGGFSLNTINGSSVYATAIAMHTLWHYRGLFSVDIALEQARTYLLSQRNTANLWGNIADTSLALIAILPTLIDRTSVDASVSALQQLRLNNGSFDNDVYQTALVERAIRVAQLPSPDAISLSGRVLDGATGLPLAAVNVALTGPVSLSLATDISGVFHFQALQAGSYQLSLTANGFSVLTTGVILQIGDQQNLDDIQLSRIGNETVPFGIVRGRVTSERTQQAIANATVAIAGSGLSTSTDSNGQYQISQIPAGNITINVTAPGFESASVPVILQANQEILFSPALREQITGVLIVGKALDQRTGSPLAGVVIRAMSGAVEQSGLTAGDGSYTLNRVPAGTISLEASLGGYDSVTASAIGSDGMTVIFSPSLLPSDSRSVTVRGLISDQSSGRPLAGVVIRAVSAGITQTAITSMDGQYVINDVAVGAISLEASLAGYAKVTASAQGVANGVIDFSAQLEPLSDTSNVSGIVSDAADGQPIAGALIQLAGSGISMLTDDAGRYAFAGIEGDTVGLIVSADGYQSISPTFALSAGPGNYEINLSLAPLTTQSATVSGVVSDAETGEPIFGASVSLNYPDNTTVQAVTDLNGAYRLSGLDIGMVTVKVSKAGYADLITSREIVTAADIRFSPTLQYLSDSGLAIVLTDATSGMSIPGAIATLIYTDGAEAVLSPSDAEGQILASGLNAGQATLSITADGYEPFAMFVEFIRNEIATLGEIMLTPNPDQPTAMGGIVLDSRTNQPLAGVTVIVNTAEENVPFSVSVATAADGVFNVEDIPTTLVSVQATLDGYVSSSFNLILQGGQLADIGQIRLRPELAQDALPNLAVTSINTQAIITQLDSLHVSGSLATTLINSGNQTVSQPFKLMAFYDRNLNSRFDSAIDPVIGSAQISQPLPVDTGTDISIDVSGIAAFRDEPISVFVDNEQTVVESDEADNTFSSLAQCRIQPPPLQDNPPAVKWHWRGPSTNPNSFNVFGPVVVGQLTDDNNDGLINARDIPDAVFISIVRLGTRGILNVIDGATGEEIWISDEPGIGYLGIPALADIDGDGIVEIVTVSEPQKSIYAFEHTGELKWQSQSLGSVVNSSDAVVIADLNADGSAEIIIENIVHDQNGKFLWGGNLDRGNNAGASIAIPIVADIDLDGMQEIVAGRTAYRFDGGVMWHQQNIGSDGYAAVGNFDADQFAEIVLVANGQVYLLEHTGDIIWGPTPIPGGGAGGPPTVADLDGDGQPEIGVAGGRNYTAFETDGSIKWLMPTQDLSSNRTGSSVFDFEGDGRVEVLYNDEEFFRIYDGATGGILFETPSISSTRLEYPIVVDIDNDSHAEILVGSGSTGFGGINAASTGGVRAFESANDSWVNTRAIWNQHAYHITNVNDDGSIPIGEQPSWLSHNTYRLNTFPDKNVLEVADLTVSMLNLIDNGAGQPFSLRARYGNGGAAASDVGAISRFYKGDPAAGGVLLGALTLPEIQSGQFVDLQLDGVMEIAAGDTVFVIVDDGDVFDECRENNNSMHIVATGMRGRLQLSLNATVFPPHADVLLNSTITNTGSLAAGYTLETRIEDVAGNLVFNFPAESTALLPGGGATDVPQTWNTGLALAGSYAAVAILRDAQGNVLDQSSVAFTIAQAGQPLASLRTTTDRQQYHTTDTVRIENLLRNISLSTAFDQGVLRLQVTSPSNAVMLDALRPIGGLTPGEFRDLFETLQLNGAEQGDYTVLGQYLDDQTLLATDQAVFSVVHDVSIALRGTAEAQSPRLFIGDTQVCNFTAINDGTMDLPAQELWQLLVNITDSSETSSTRVLQDLPANASAAFIGSFVTDGLTAGDYACVLEATVNGERLSLAHSVFRLEPPPIRIDAELALGQQGRVLIWMDDEDRYCKDREDHGHGHDSDSDDWHRDHNYRAVDKGRHSHKRSGEGRYGKHRDKDGKDCHDRHESIHKDEPPLAVQRAWLEQALNAAGIAYTLVTSESAFVHKFHSGEYNQYLVLAEKARLHPHFIEELREAVYRGEGLIVAGGDRHQLYKAMREPLGLKQPPEPDSGHGYAEVAGIELFESSFHPAAQEDFARMHRVLKVQPDTAQVLGRFTGIRKQAHNYEHDDCEDNDEEYDHHESRYGGASHGDDNCKPRPSGDIPALTHNAYGDGKAMYIGFDVLSEATRDDAALLFEEILLQALRVTRPESVNTRAGAVLPIVLSLDNLGIAVSGQAMVTLPAGSRIIDVGGGVRLTDNSLSFSYMLTEQAQAEFTLWVVPAYSNGHANVEAVIQANGQTLETVQLQIDEQPAPTAEVILQSLSALRHEDRDLNDAWQDMKNAQRALARGDTGSALHHLLKATDDLADSRHQAAPALRRDIDWLLWLLWRLGPDLRGDHHHDHE